MVDDGQQAHILSEAGHYVQTMNDNIHALSTFPERGNPNLIFWNDKMSISAHELFCARTDFGCKIICAGMKDYNPESEIDDVEKEWEKFLKSVQK
jgi:hypothetical protein